MSKLKVLYVSSEIFPFVSYSSVADYVRKLPQSMQERGMEIRILVPRFGIINERKNRLHEVVRLSGINISIAEEEKPLTIKVASVPNAKLQVYFIDNDDYFHRKSFLTDSNENFFADNDERAIFFCKGVIETVKKLGWAPDIVHCNDWMTGLIPLYLKTAYKNEPMFKDAKTVFTIYNTSFNYKFDENLLSKVKLNDIEDSMLSPLKSADFEGFIGIGATYSDFVTRATHDADDICRELLAGKNVQTVEMTEDYSDKYFSIYQGLTS
jgi:starch synthase